MDQIQDKVIEQLYREMYSQLEIYAYSILQDNALAEEAVQEAFRIACGKKKELLDSCNPRGWIVNTLKNVMSNMLRSRACLNSLVVASLSDCNREEIGASDEISVDVLYGDISHTDEYKLIKKIALEKCTMMEASEELGISVESCKKRVQRARKKLQQHFLKNEE